MSEATDIVGRARTVFGPRLLGMFAFGSRVGGRARADSDLDVGVWLEGSVRRRTTWLPWVDAFGGDDPTLDPTFFTTASLDSPPSWLLEAVRDGVDIWFDPTGQLAARVAALRSGIEAGLYRRRLFMGLPYWAQVAS